MIQEQRYHCSQGDEMARGQVVAWSHDASGNMMGRAHTNNIFNTRMYQVEFAGGNVTEFTTNVIAKSMYAKCNSDGNEYLLLDMIVDCCKNNKVISLLEQQVSTWGRLVIHKTTAG